MMNWRGIRVALTIVLIVAFGGCSWPDGVEVVEQTADDRSPSVARSWNEVVLGAIRNDFARPTVHARNLFHISSAMYDAWSVYSDIAESYLLGKQLGAFSCNLDNFTAPDDLFPAREEAIAYAAYRLILHRFAASPGAVETTYQADNLMQLLGFDTSNASLTYQDGTPAAMGNYIAQCYIDFGFQDGANELNAYANTIYVPVNPAIEPVNPGNPNIVDLDRWQPISLLLAIDQSGNTVINEPPFLGPEWGQVEPFARSDADKTTYQRAGFDYEVYFDPGAPPGYSGASADDYKWGFSLVSIWASHLDPSDGVMIDISPGALGNIQQYPASVDEFDQFYDYLDGGDGSQGYAVNPVTGASYVPQIVPRGDYTRVLAEFWADGPRSETPPGHWFVIINEVNDHPLLVRQFGGQGPELGPLEWDVKSYFTLGGAMHDSAIAAWGIKGWYDYVRPVSAIRAMADRGQSSEPLAASYSVDGLPLVAGLIELVGSGDPLAGAADENVGKIKLYTWRGPEYILNPAIDQAGVGLILADNWWPYQRPSFVTPPFAGYISGHSTYSRAAAEVLTLLTGSEYFPGGMSGFDIVANEFLVFEEGPSVDMTLQ